MPAVQSSGVTQDSGVKTAEVGGTVTLQCLCQDDSVTFIFWYQQTLGGKPQLISTQMKHKTEAEIYPEFKERFQVCTKSGESINHLTITDLRLEDSATYYCGILEFNAIEFGQGAFLHVKTSLSNIQAVVHQPSLEPLQSGDSVNLSCTVTTEPRGGNQSFYWIRYGASQPAVMYPSAGQCTNSNKESIMNKCTINLSIKSVSSSDAGIYYCALASCGEIVFGNGTEIKIAGMWWQLMLHMIILKKSHKLTLELTVCEMRFVISSLDFMLGGSAKVPILLVYCLSAALAVLLIVFLVLAFIVHKLKKKLCSVCKGKIFRIKVFKMLLY